jgi:hypothetical protein
MFSPENFLRFAVPETLRGQGLFGHGEPVECHDGLTFAECQRLTRKIANERAKVQRMAATR